MGTRMEEGQARAEGAIGRERGTREQLTLEPQQPLRHAEVRLTPLLPPHHLCRQWLRWEAQPQPPPAPPHSSLLPRAQSTMIP